MQPLFKEGIRDIASLREDTRLTGKVTNVTHFGAFVDIGVGRDGLIHNSNMKRTDLQLGHRVEVKVIKMDKAGNRIGLNLEHKLWKKYLNIILLRCAITMKFNMIQFNFVHLIWCCNVVMT